MCFKRFKDYNKFLDGIIEEATKDALKQTKEKKYENYISYSKEFNIAIDHISLCQLLQSNVIIATYIVN